MAGRSPRDTGARNTRVIQVCLPEEQAELLKELAQESEHKTVSVWLRHKIDEVLLAGC